MTTYRRITILKDELPIVVESGYEWHSKAIPLRAGDVITVSALADHKFYAGLFGRDEYFEKRKAAAGAFAFEFGTDKPQWTTRREIPLSDDYYLVFRVGVFTNKTTIRGKVEVLRPTTSGTVQSG
jgi:hypothetical protein